jgi:glycosyltransferase involved in cell wall biosynthesis
MPVSLGEAMLCECIPVGSNVNGIPDAIGETGVIVKQRDILELCKAVKGALSMESGESAKARTHSLFSFERRSEKIESILNRLLLP